MKRLKKIANSKEEKYNEVINLLMNNDKNGTWDEILSETNNNIDEATDVLISSLERIVNEEGYEGDELQFYINQLNLAKSIN